MEYYLSINGQTVGPMPARQVFAYNPTAKTIVSNDGVNWQPLMVFPELMEIYSREHRQEEREEKKKEIDTEVHNKKVLVGIMAILFGGLGVHYFMLGKTGAGFTVIGLSLIVCLVQLPITTFLFINVPIIWLLTAIQGILILCMSDEDFKRRYMDSKSFMPF